MIGMLTVNFGCYEALPCFRAFPFCFPTMLAILNTTVTMLRCEMSCYNVRKPSFESNMQIFPNGAYVKGRPRYKGQGVECWFLIFWLFFSREGDLLGWK